MTDTDHKESFANWLSEKMNETRLTEFMPSGNIDIICHRAVEFFFKDNTIETTDLFDWIASEYGAPPEVLVEAFRSAKAGAEKMGVTILMPGEELEWKDSGPDLVEEPVTQSAEPDTAPPGPPAASERAEPGQEQTPAWQIRPPTPHDPEKYLAAFLNDPAYFEFVLLGHVNGSRKEKIELLEKALGDTVRLSDEEHKILMTAGLEPVSSNDTVEAMVLKIDGLALALAYALEMARNRSGYNFQDWLRGVRRLFQQVDELTPAALDKYRQARELGEIHQLAMKKSWDRLKDLKAQTEPECKALNEMIFGGATTESSEAGAQPPTKASAMQARKTRTPLRTTKKSRKRPAKDSDEGLRETLRKYTGFILVCTIVLLILASIYTVMNLGMFGGQARFESVDLDLSGLPLAPAEIMSSPSDKVLILVYDDAAWEGLPREAKETCVTMAYQKAKQAGLEGVAVRSSGNQVLAQVWPGGKFRIFE